MSSRLEITQKLLNQAITELQLAESALSQAVSTFRTATASSVAIYSRSRDNKPAILAAFDQISNALQAVQVAYTVRRNAFDHRRAVAEQAIIVSSEVMSSALASLSPFAEVNEYESASSPLVELEEVD